MKRKLSIFLLFAINLAAQAQQKNCALPNSGLVPMNELGAQKYRGYTGGLYSNGNNLPAVAYLTDALDIANTIVPLDTNGNAVANGKIVFAGVGASNPRTEFAAFIKHCDTFGNINTKLEFVNTCIGGQGVQKMNDPMDNYWKSTLKLFDSVKLNVKQVQIVWLETDNTQAADTVFPRAPQALLQDLKVLMQTLKLKFPNLKLCYLSARAYAGWIDLSSGGLPGKGLLAPRDYYNGWAIKWLIDSANAGNKGFEYKGNLKKIAMPLFATYHWTNGSETRKDGFAFDCNTDVGPDGLHLTAAGELKIGKEMFNFFAKAETTQKWFLQSQALGNTLTIKPTFILYPNPASGSDINFSIPVKFESAEIFIYNAAGQLIIYHKVIHTDNLEKINLKPNLNNGTYYCRMVCNGKIFETQTFLIVNE